MTGCAAARLVHSHPASPYSLPPIPTNGLDSVSQFGQGVDPRPAQSVRAHTCTPVRLCTPA